MICVVQRVTSARVCVDDRIVGQIGPGLLALAAICREDTESDLVWMTRKLLSMRIFPQDDRHFDRSVAEVGGGVLLVSNFTVAAANRQGRRPSFDPAAPPEEGRVRFDRFVELVRQSGLPVATGAFGTDMKVESINDGPATFILESRRVMSDE